MNKVLLLAAVALAAGGCEVRKGDGQAASQGGSGALSQADAEKVAADTLASFTSGDAFKIMEHYAPGAVAFDPAHPDATSDRAILTKWSADFVAMKPSDLVASPRQVQVLDRDTIVSSGIATFLGDAGGHRQRLSARFSQVLQRQPDGKWRIAHEHMSIPPAPMGAQ